MSFGSSILKILRINAISKISTSCGRLMIMGEKRRTFSSFLEQSRRLPHLFDGNVKQKKVFLQPTHSVHTQTDGDKDLITFLHEEIGYEKENVMEVPEFNDFKLEMKGTHVSLSRKFNNEKVEIYFDVNENVNVDEEVGDEHPDEDVTTPDIVSYPHFTVTISKPSGNTLHFNCSCNTGLNEGDLEDDSPEDEQFDLFRFESVKIYATDTLHETVFEADTETMDGELYSMLMTTLLERGVNGVFINDLIDLSTSVEQRHYLTFLKTLQDFMSTK